MGDQSPLPSRPLWASVADGFYVGSRDGSFLGYIDRQADGAWRAFDTASRPLGDYEDHHRAMDAVSGAEAVGAAPADAHVRQGDAG
ncbi:hypothetical protein JOF42_003416 [Microbacterium phyllosphaerae]|uniref:Uncharacterized protein n=1 Tax=Microbacterium phyllosphaerae TaxID=124798 RepID=A0ABS4WUU8_9MICO|nr:hypothetical protein [Microbacterium phyllosphaerae]MBP2379921.1 hypothetical protein [Microbacterium phyllosphaerae]